MARTPWQRLLASSEGQTATITACVNGTNQCVTYSAFGARSEYATLPAVDGTVQHLAGTATAPAPISMRLLDMRQRHGRRHSRALPGLVRVAPPCNPHVVCPPGILLSAQSATATSAIDGLITFTPATLPGVATNLQAIAVTGYSAVLPIAIEQH